MIEQEGDQHLDDPDPLPSELATPLVEQGLFHLAVDHCVAFPQQIESFLAAGGSLAQQQGRVVHAERLQDRRPLIDVRVSRQHVAAQRDGLRHVAGRRQLVGQPGGDGPLVALDFVTIFRLQPGTAGERIVRINGMLGGT